MNIKNQSSPSRLTLEERGCAFADGFSQGWEYAEKRIREVGFQAYLPEALEAAAEFEKMTNFPLLRTPDDE